MPLEQDHAVRRQGDRCRLLLQRPRQAILLRCGLRVPTEDTGCEAEIGLREVSSGEFMDYTEKMTIPEIRGFLYNHMLFSLSISG